MKAYLGSKNIVKINATKEVLEKYGFEVIGVDVDSQVSAQPKCDAETIQGALNRALALPTNSFRIGLEAGVELLGDWVRGGGHGIRTVRDRIKLSGGLV